MKSHVALSAPALVALALCLAGSPRPCRAAPLSATAAVQTQPDPASPVIAYLKAGSEPVPAGEGSVAPPPGWMTVELPGPFEGYVMDKDFNKGLDVRPGSSIYLAPKPDAGVLAVAAAGDKIVITGLDGKWTQVRLEKKIVGYVNLAPIASAPPALVTEAAPAPAAAPAAGTARRRRSDSTLPRSLEGKFVAASHHVFGAAPPPSPGNSRMPPGPAWPISISASSSSPTRRKITSAGP